MSFVNPLSNSQPTDPNKPNLVRKLFPGPNGPQVQYVDPRTGQVVQNTQGYNIVDPQIQDIDSLGLNLGQPETPEQKTPEEPKIPVSSYQSPTLGEGHGMNNNNSGSAQPSGGDSQGNNFGYINKPGWMGMTGALPGIPGLIGKGINAAVNVNNVQAINKARDAADLPGLTGMQELGGTLKDRQGFVGRVNIKNQDDQTNQYSVGLEAADPWGRTTLTPDEARKRALADPTNISLADEQAPKDKKAKGPLGQLVRSFVDKLFSDEEDTKVSKDSHPSAPKATGFNSLGGSGNLGSTNTYDGSSYAGTNKGDDSPSEAGGRFGNVSHGGLGLSGKAKSDVDGGKGGLY